MSHHHTPLPHQGEPYQHGPDTPEADRSRASFLEDSLQPWHDRMQQLMDNGTHIIALRGAGSANGISPLTANEIVYTLYRHISNITDTETPVVIMYDGDEDDRTSPHLGSVFGALADFLRDNSRVTPIAVQTSKWYKPVTPGAALQSATGLPYETYVFNKDMPEIGENLRGRGLAHSALTQSPQLVAYEPRWPTTAHAGYEQVIVGASGPIAAEQLRDLSRKAAVLRPDHHPVSVTVLSARVNPALDASLRASATSHPEDDKRLRAAEKLEQRAAYPYGLLCTPDGSLALNPADYAGIQFQFQRMD